MEVEDKFMNIKRIVVGELQTNCYLIYDDDKVLVIDPGDEYFKIKKEIGNKKVEGILITHKHFDHIGCIKNLVNDYGVYVYDNSNLNEGENKISIFKFKMIKTYGHTMDSISFYFEESKVMFTGDFLFYNTIGRCDFRESNEMEMYKSIKKIKDYPDDTLIYPGHGINTTLGREKMCNIYFR